VQDDQPPTESVAHTASNKSAEVPQLVADLDLSVCALEGQLWTLSERLEAVLVEPSEAKDGAALSNATHAPPATQIGRKLRGTADNVDRLGLIVADLIARIGL